MVLWSPEDLPNLPFPRPSEAEASESLFYMPLQPRCPKRRCFLTKPFYFPIASVPSAPTPRFPVQMSSLPAPQTHNSSSGSPATLRTVSLAPRSLKLIQILQNRTRDLYHRALPCSMLDHQPPPTCNVTLRALSWQVPAKLQEPSSTGAPSLDTCHIPC